MKQTYFDWYEFDINAVATGIATCTCTKSTLQ